MVFGFGGIYVLYVLANFGKLKTAVRMISVSCKPMHSLKQLFFFPLMQTVVAFGIMIGLGTLLMYSVTTGTIETVEDDNIPGGKAKIIQYSQLD